MGINSNALIMQKLRPKSEGATTISLLGLTEMLVVHAIER